MTWDVPTEFDCPSCGHKSLMDKNSGSCIGGSSLVFFPEDHQRGSGESPKKNPRRPGKPPPRQKRRPRRRAGGGAQTEDGEETGRQEDWCGQDQEENRGGPGMTEVE